MEVIIGTGVDTSITILAKVDETAGISGANVRVFEEETADPHSHVETIVKPFIAAVTVERRYNLPAGSPTRIEVQITAGNTGLPVSVSAFTTSAGGSSVPVTATGVTGESIAVELAA